MMRVMKNVITTATSSTATHMPRACNPIEEPGAIGACQKCAGAERGKTRA